MKYSHVWHPSAGCQISFIGYALKLCAYDYSEALVQLAGRVIQTKDLRCMEADCISAEPKYDLVLADSVFQYFQNPEYGMRVLEKCGKSK